MRVKDRRRGPTDARPPSKVFDRPVPVLALPSFTLFPGTLVPLSAFESEPCRTLGAALADARLIVIAALDAPGPERAVHAIAGLGRIVSDRRHPDGRIDAFVHGLERVRLGEVRLGQDGLSAAELEVIPDSEGSASVGEAGVRLFAVTSSLARALGDAHAAEAEALTSLVASSDELGLIANRLAATFVESFEERQELLEERCPARRSDAVAAVLGELLLVALEGADQPLH